MAETVIGGKRIVRLMPRTFPIGFMRMRMWVVTDLHSRRAIGINHTSREQAARWVAGQGWRYIGPQERIA